MSEKLSMHDHGNCELCDQIESELAQAQADVEALHAYVQADLLIGLYVPGDYRHSNAVLDKGKARLALPERLRGAS